MNKSEGMSNGYEFSALKWLDRQQEQQAILHQIPKSKLTGTQPNLE